MPETLYTMTFKCGHSLTVEASRIIGVGSSVRCSQCGKSTKVVSTDPS
jgi:hypothetical protein